ncbi:MAG TPA: AAA family ATPase [Planctomycetota bacterium]|nr:AAA family ATPase [Planctomycetota bacterium]
MGGIGPVEAALTHDAVAHCFLREGTRVELSPKAYALLVALTRTPNRLVTKQELLNEVWPGVVVGEAVLKVVVNEIRNALDDDAKAPRFVATEHRRGYRFVGRCTAGGAAVDPSQSAPAGRRDALRFLRERLARAELGERQVVFVAGEAGIGKTTLLDAFLATLPPGFAARVGRGECVETYGAHEPYAPILEAFARLARGPPRNEVVDTLRRLAPTWLLQLPALTHGEGRAELVRELFGSTRDRMVREAGDAIDALAATTPLVLAFEDLHWADASTLDLVGALARREGAAKLLVVATWRPIEAILAGTPVRALKETLLAQRRGMELQLEVLDADGVAEHLRARFPGVEVPDRVARRVHDACDGHPLFMRHAVDWLAEHRRLCVKDGRLELDAAAESLQIDLPESLSTLLTREVERLSRDEVEALEIASVAGVDFSAATVACGLDRAVVATEELLERFVRRGQYLRSRGVMEWPDGTISASYEFRHSLYRDFLYRRVAAARRVALHRVIGLRGEQVFGARAAEIAAPLAIHFEQGRDPARAVRYLELLARTDARRCAHADSAAALTRALALVEGLPEADRRRRSIELLLARGSTWRTAGEMAKASADYEEAARRAAESGDRGLELRAQLLIASAASWIDFERCKTAVAAARRLLPGLADEETRRLARGVLAYWDLLIDGDGSGVEASADALRQASASGDAGLEGEHAVRHAFLLLAADRAEDAATLARRGRELCRAADNAFDPMVGAFVEVLALLRSSQRDRFDELLGEARRHAEQNGHRAFALLFSLLSHWRDVEDGELERAAVSLPAALEEARTLKHVLSERLALTLLARLAERRGGPSRALPLDEELARGARERHVLMQWITDLARQGKPPPARSRPGSGAKRSRSKRT